MCNGTDCFRSYTIYEADMRPKRQEVFDQIEAIFKEGNFVHRVRMFEFLLSGLDPAPSPLKWINPFVLASLSDQEPDAPDYYTIGVRYPDGRVLEESHYAEGDPKAPMIELTVDEANEMLEKCLASVMKELSRSRVL